MNSISVLIKRPGTDPERLVIENSLQAFQECINDWLEFITADANKVLICAENGRLKHMQANSTVNGITIRGTFILAGIDTEGNITDYPS